MRRPKVQIDLRPYYKNEERGHNKKSLIVLHETVSHNVKGVSDIIGVASYMDSTGLEIHGIIDKEGNSGWCYDPTAVYDHAASGRGTVNSRSIGFELVSEIPFAVQNGNPGARELWNKPDRKTQLNKVAEWIAYLHTELGIPLAYSNASRPGITTHWDVSKTYLGGHGHWDCKPYHKGGHFPVLYVVQKARNIIRAQKGV